MIIHAYLHFVFPSSGPMLQRIGQRPGKFPVSTSKLNQREVAGPTRPASTWFRRVQLSDLSVFSLAFHARIVASGTEI